MPIRSLLTGCLRVVCALWLSSAFAHAAPAPAAPAASDPINDAREALRKRDAKQLAALRSATLADKHPLAQWVDYWELGNRIGEATVAEVEVFYQRWSGSYVEDRMRNDWLLELGRRRDWVSFVRDYPRFRMNDDREVSCYWQLTEHIAGKRVFETARALWLAQRDLDDGCVLMAGTLVESKVFRADDTWLKLRLSVEANRPRMARAVAPLIDKQAATDVGELLDNPVRYLRRRGNGASPPGNELALLAIVRAATSDPDAAAGLMDERWHTALGPERAAWAWAVIGKQAALRLSIDAPQYYKRAFASLPSSPRAAQWTDDMLAWAARSALRAGRNGDRWPMVLRAISSMSDSEQLESTWIYWKARALTATADEGNGGDSQREAARALLASIAGPLTFYGKLAAEELGFVPELPSLAPTPSEADRAQARANPGLSRALQMISLGLRNEGVREWNFTLRGMSERELFAAAELACEREVWDRCINTSDRTRQDIDMAQRYPMPFRDIVLARSQETGLDPAYVFGLIRQESRFIPDARSNVGAAGLMQLMPNTARWVARKLALDYRPDQIIDPLVNVRLGTGYLKLVLEDFGGSQAMAAAAYNAGPNRPRRWREGPAVEPAIWAENIPFNETRDYVRKVLSNAAVYASLLNGTTLSLKSWLGPAAIGPRDTAAPAIDVDLP
ncbi:MAG TPA: transglycosylase SLT domain-containing protein [Burkholderiaceae bacterium]|nr:transglycosylase SLT domain-containing protein [Burkholderiaceae bacterium]